MSTRTATRRPSAATKAAATATANEEIAESAKLAPATVAVSTVPGILPMSEIDKLDPDGSLTLAKLCDDSQRAAYITIGKIMVRLRDHKFDGGIPLATKLREAGIRKTTIDNARRLMNAYLNLVVDEHMTEADFDTHMGYSECVTVAKAMDTAKAKKAFTAKEAAAFILANPDSFVDEFESFAAYGLSVADKVIADNAPKTKTTPATKPATGTPATPPAVTTTATVTTATPPVESAAPTPAAPPAVDEGKIIPLPPVDGKPAAVSLPEGATKLCAAMHDLIGECEDVGVLRTLSKALNALAEAAAIAADDAELAALEAEQPATVG
jgi:hypothetical protein